MIKLGNNDITLKVGSNDVSAAYLGSIQVYGGSTPPTPSFDGKWLATYTGGTTSSAQCDASSAITSGEITSRSAITTFEIGDCVTSIGGKAFAYCSGLTSVTIPNSVTNIGQYAFAQCDNLASIAIPSGLTSIGNRAFAGTSITSVGGTSSGADIEIPNSVTSISDGTFQYCRSLTSVTIPDSVTSIDRYAFNNCTSLTSVTIGNGVTSIGNYAFQTCSSLQSITCLAVVPPILDGSAFDNTNDCPIYVPSGSLTDYQSEWADYAFRIQPIP